MEYCLGTNPKYIGKFEHSMNLTINTHRNDVWRADGPPCDKHFQNAGYKFNEHAKFTIIEKINNASLPKHREDFWILKLETLSAKGLNIS